jgi:hypothetical protein
VAALRIFTYLPLQPSHESPNDNRSIQSTGRMNAPCSNHVALFRAKVSIVESAAMRPALRHWVTAPLAAVAFLMLAACNGTAVVTLTATASTDTFLAYRVGLVSVELQTANRNTTTKALPASTTVDLVKLVNLSEVLGSTTVAKANTDVDSRSCQWSQRQHQ